MTRDDIVAEARTWVGTPWRHQAMRKGAGADCVGFLIGVGLALGYADATVLLKDRRLREHGKLADESVIDAVCEEYLDPIEVADARMGDVLRLRPPRGVYAQHFGLVSRVNENGRPTHIIHCTNATPRGVTEHILDDEWRSRIRRAYTWRGVA